MACLAIVKGSRKTQDICWRNGKQGLDSWALKEGCFHNQFKFTSARYIQRNFSWYMHRLTVRNNEGPAVCVVLLSATRSWCHRLTCSHHTLVPIWVFSCMFTAPNLFCRISFITHHRWIVTALAIRSTVSESRGAYQTQQATHTEDIYGQHSILSLNHQHWDRSVNWPILTVEIARH